MKMLDTIPTSLSDAYIINRRLICDDRGSLNRIFCKSDLSECIRDKKINQINITKTSLKGTIRGLHFQIGHFSETKIVTCLRGSVFDVIVDIRPNSRTYLRYQSIYLSEENNQSVLIPEGFAHGFQSLENNSELLYLHTAPYNKYYEKGIDAFDPKLNINWPLPVTLRSSRDQSFSKL